MKKIYTLLLLSCLFSLPLFSANGYLRYSIKYSGPDQNNPKVMLYPTQIEVFVSDEAILVRSSGGFLAGMLGNLVWYTSNPDSLYLVSHASSTINISLYKSPLTKDFTVKKGSTKHKTAGHEGNEYKVSCNYNDSTLHWRVWSATQPVLTKFPFSFHPPQLSLLLQQDIRLLPLKLEYEQHVHEMHLTVTINLEEENNKKQDAGIFELPSNYKRKHLKPGEKARIGSGG